MKSQNLAHIPALDHLRLLAALLVLVFHTFHQYFGHWQPAPYAAALGLVTEGHTGVALFFVLSGFLFMTIALQSEGIAYGAFMRNRFLRIFPLFLFFFFIAISVVRDKFSATDVLYVFFSNIGKPPTSEHFITGAAWTISVEFTFYLVFPFLARFVRAEGAVYLLRLLVLMALVKLAAWGVAERATLVFYSTLVGRFDQFLWGMLAALCWQRYASVLQRHGRWLLVLALALLWLASTVQARYASYFSPEPRQAFWVFWGTAEALVWAGVVLAYLGAGIAWPRPLARWLERGGAWSYSLYLWHGLVLFVLHRAVGGWMPLGSVAANAVLHFALVLPLSLAVAWLSFITIEQPFLRLRGRYVQ
ncbi:MAG: acyltransferase [Giesbergeria sp.]|nr:acyltransferase [Giesbergeria sp.]